MAKTIKIQGVIEPDMLKQLAEQIEEQKIESGDKVNVLFDSIGGVIDVAFGMAEVFDTMQSEGIELRAVAEGKVYSSAIIPFLAIENRVGLKHCSVLVHPARYEMLTDVTLDSIEETKAELGNYTEMMEEFYEEHGVPKNIRKHLRNGSELTLRGRDLIKAGFITDFVTESAQLYNKFRAAVDKYFPAVPQFNYILNSNQISSMTSKQVKAMVDKAISEVIPGIVAGVAKAVNEALTAPEEEPMNKATELTKDELAKLKGYMHKTPVEVEGNEEVKYLVHGAKDLEIDHDVWPIAEGGDIVKLEAGDHKCKVDGEDFVIHSTGDEWFIHSKDVANQDPTPAPTPDSTPTPTPAPTNEDPEENDEPKDPKPEEEDPKPEDKPKPQNKGSQAPKRETGKVPVNKSNIAKEAYELFQQYGPGCVGAK